MDEKKLHDRNWIKIEIDKPTIGQKIIGLFNWPSVGIYEDNIGSCKYTGNETNLNYWIPIPSEPKVGLNSIE